MKNENGLNQLNNNLKDHKTFSIYDNDGLFVKYEYDNELKRYQSLYGYLTIEEVYTIARDKEEIRYIIWE